MDHNKPARCFHSNQKHKLLRGLKYILRSKSSFISYAYFKSNSVESNLKDIAIESCAGPIMHINLLHSVNKWQVTAVMLHKTLFWPRLNMHLIKLSPIMPGALPTKRLNILILKKKKKNPQDAINIFSSETEERTFCYSHSLKLH